MRCRRWREGENDCMTALGWTPEGRRARGRVERQEGGQRQHGEEL